MTISETLDSAYNKTNNLESNQIVVQRLLAHVLAQPTSHFWAHPEIEISKQQQLVLDEMVDRASMGEPLEYVLGRTEFYGQVFRVDPRVLIPRPETEALVELTIEYCSNLDPHSPSLTIIDVGTGSGCLGLTLGKHLPQAQVYAIDISPEALDVARSNASLMKISNVTFLQGSLLEPLAALQLAEPADVIVANLPYISDEEYPKLDRNVRDYEPALALRSGATPDRLNSELAEQVPHHLKPDGLFAYETTNGRIVCSKSSP